MNSSTPIPAEVLQTRENAHLRALLENDVPQELEAFLQGCRPFTGATLAMMQQTRNEWLKRVLPSEMENHFLATLSWLFIQAAPEKTVRKAVFGSREAFLEAVLEWGNEDVNGQPRVSPEVLAAADAIIQHTLGLVDAANYSVVDKPGGEDSENAPPN